MKVKSIEGKCSGHARCWAVAPDVYRLDDDGYLNMVETEIAADREAIARRGARACPERAIAIIED